MDFRTEIKSKVKAIDSLFSSSPFFVCLSLSVSFCTSVPVSEFNIHDVYLFTKVIARDGGGGGGATSMNTQ